MLSFKSDTKKTLVTIENWDLYQSKETPKEQQSFTEETQKHIKSTTEAYQKHTNKNEKNEENDKEVYIDLKFVDEVIGNLKIRIPNTRGNKDRKAHKYSKLGTLPRLARRN